MKIKQEDGTEIDVFTQEEVDAKAKEAADKAAAEALDAYKKEHPEDPTPNPKEEDQPPAWAKPLIDKVAALDGNQTKSHLSRVLNGLDADKQKEVEAKFETLTTGYDSTPDGLARRAEDAYLLATGAKFEGDAFNMGNLGAAGGQKPAIGDSAAQTATDKTVQTALGITPEDVKKYGAENK